ncbi:NTP transferase domain-containing protein [Candidatus Uhrbacteria bacterium]|nr:NTP transferase domain-containing protein [Candidatus Uhrbacteria bacterium]
MTIRDAMRRLNETSCRILFVTDDHARIIGVVTDGNIRRAIANGTGFTDVLASIMTTTFVSIDAERGNVRQRAVALMRKHDVAQVPVLDAGSRLVDVVTWRECLPPGDGSAPPPQPRHTHAVVVMAGGKGTRLDPFTRILPKPLIPIREKPIIEHITDRFVASGFHRFILVVNYKREMLKLYFNELAPSYDVHFVEEQEFLGTAGGLTLLVDHVRDNKPFILTNCDTLLEGDYADILRWHEDQGNAMTIVASHKIVQLPYGVLRLRDGAFHEMQEKPEIDMLVNTGTYIIDPKVLTMLKSGQHCDMDELITTVHRSGSGRVGVYPHWGEWLDIGQWEAYRESVARISA